jgi:intron-binding protein aquarius
MRPACKQDGYAAANDVGDYYGVDQTMDVDEGSKTEFRGWARMGLELGSIKRDKPGVRLLRVDPPRLGEAVPSQVIAEIVLDLHSCATALTKEWDEIKEFDNLFLICVDASMATGDPAPLLNEIGKNGEERRVPDEEDCTFPRRFGVKAVRGCMVLEVRDEAGTLLSDPAFMQEGGMPAAKGKLRFLRVALDPAQFALDSSGRGSPLGINVYEKLNLVVRRSGRENNFKAVLETIRGLMKGGANSMFRSIPSWLMPVLLGYGGDPTMASYASPKMLSFASKTTGVTHPHAALDYGDTFLDVSHLRESFNGYELTVDGIEISDDSDVKANVTERKKYRVKVIDEKQKTLKVMATSYPFPPSYAGNAIRFTPIQVSAIRSGLSPGLTTIVGPPGTGKTDVAVQIIANLYHSFPTQRTVIVTHSNAALNDIFDKVMARGDVDERYMLRLGSGERNLTTTSSSSHDFTKTGRVAHILSRRSGLLEKVQLLSESLGLSGRSERGADGAPSYSCETSEYFYKHLVLKRVDLFEATVLSMGDDSKSANCIDIFPFRAYFPTLNHGSTLSLDEARAKFSEIKAIFDELAEYRPIELLRSQVKRTDYLLTKQARVVAMTCTHAAIARSHLVELGFHYDNIIMEESAQMLDVETFIPLLLQRGESDDGSSDASLAAHSRLKRICLIGNHNQLPPVVKNQTFCRYSHYDQSLFARLIHLGVPAIHLNKQGRARQEIARLYSWRYDSLGDLGHVSTGDVFQRANTGLAHTFQLIDVDDFEGRGESTPTAFFYQNIGEAEYCVALFQFMVLLGYPPEKISIITTYNGQKELILDILTQRCGNGTPLAGIAPAAVSTVDQYQGQQNDYIILSLVRTKAVGHLRDIRRLVVAVSRARLGLYVFCRKSLFCGCHELRHTMKQLADRPCKLQLIKGEQYPTDRLSGGDISNSDLLEVNGVSELGALVHSMQQKHIANQLLTT